MKTKRLSTRLLLVVSLADERVLGQDEGDNEPVQTQSFGKDENQDHTDKELFLLTHSAHTGVSDNSNGHARRETRQPTAQTGRQVRKSRVQRILAQSVLWRDDGSLNDDGNNEAVDAEHTRHDDRNDVSHDQTGVHDTHGRDADSGLGRAVRGSDIRKDQGGGYTHEAKERRRGRAGFHFHTHNYSGKIVVCTERSIAAKTEAKRKIVVSRRNLINKKRTRDLCSPTRMLS